MGNGEQTGEGEQADEEHVLMKDDKAEKENARKGEGNMKIYRC